MNLTEIENIPYPPYHKTFTVENDIHRINLNIIGWDEPNYGRELHVVQLFINDVDRTKDFFEDWNRISVELDKYQFSGNGNRFCFIPAEKQYFLIDTLTLKKVELPTGGHCFTGNIFDKGKHLLITDKLLLITDLYKEETIAYNFPDDQSIEWAYFIDDNNLRLIHYFSNKCSVFNLESGTITDSTAIISNEMFKDTFRWIVWSYKKRDTQNVLEIEWVGNRDKNKQRRSFLLED